MLRLPTKQTILPDVQPKRSLHNMHHDRTATVLGHHTESTTSCYTTRNGGIAYRNQLLQPRQHWFRAIRLRIRQADSALLRSVAEPSRGRDLHYV